MSILQLSSNHPQFSFLISKNPESGMMIKPIRKGRAFGWYFPNDTYHVYFKDADNELSYPKNKEETFEYLNTSRYNTPVFPLNAVSDFFSSAFKKPHPDDVAGYHHRFTVSMVYLEHTHYIRLFQQHFPEFQLHAEEVAPKNFQIAIHTTRTLEDLLHYANLFFVFLSILERRYFDITDDTIGKYIRSLNRLDAPFFIRYLFSRNLLNKKESFRKFQLELEKTDRYHIQLQFGNTAQQRFAWISEQLSFRHSIVDIGCGEGAYAIPYSKKLLPNGYVHAIDIDEQMRDRVQHKAKVREIENLIVYESLSHYLENPADEKMDVIVTEVIEHMELEEAKELIGDILKHITFHQLVITTPNQDFNEYYMIDNRHHDHKWEMTEKDFHEWLSHVIPDSFCVSFAGVGDRVNKIPTTLGAVICKKEEIE